MCLKTRLFHFCGHQKERYAVRGCLIKLQIYVEAIDMLRSYILSNSNAETYFLRLCVMRTAPQFKPLIKFTYICYVLYFPFPQLFIC